MTRWSTLVLLVLVPPMMAGCPLAKTRPFDPIARYAVDDNGLPLDPHWAGQGQNGTPVDSRVCAPSGDAQDYPANWSTGEKSCTTRGVTIERGNACGPHVNWFPVAYTGKIKWNGWSNRGGKLEDDEYNVEMLRDDKALYSIDRTDAILCEFDSEETIDHLETPFWKQFHTAVNKSDGDAHNFLDGKQAIMVGLLGLDCAGHVGGSGICGAELHPVYMLAVRIPCLTSVCDPAIDHWAFFVRNRGNQGWCASNEQMFPGRDVGGGRMDYFLMLPRPEAVGGKIQDEGKELRLFGKGRSGDPGENFEAKFIQGKGMLLRFILPDPATVGDSDDFLIEGDISVKWALP